MECDSALYINEITKFAGKWTELGGIILSEVTQIQKEKKNSMLSFIWNPIILWSGGGSV